MGPLIFLLVFTVSLAVFASQNTQGVHLRFLLWQSHEISLALVIIFSAALGAVLALVASFPTYHRRRKELLAHKRELEDLREKMLS